MRRIAIIILSTVVLISLDMISKYIFSEYYFSGRLCSAITNPPEILSFCNNIKYVPIIWEYIGFSLSYNSGVAFSLPIRGLFLQIITVILVVSLMVYYLRIEYPKKSKLLDVGYILIVAGALSHAYERIFVGHVIDFIAIKYFAILNFADIFISIGAALLFIAYYVHKR